MIPLTFANLSLIGFLWLCGYLSYCCFTPPNPTPATPKLYKNDRLRGGVTNVMLRKWMFGFGLSYQSTLILFPEYHAKMCLNPDALNPALLQWSWYTSTFVIIVLIFAPLRLLAYAGLGKNFTFALAKPNKLITTGVYRHVQHPSYTGLVLLLGVWYWTLMRLDGAAACLLPSWIIDIKTLTLVPSFLMSIVTLAGLWVRVKDEETMMEKEFGKEWVEYHSKTKRFIPGVF